MLVATLNQNIQLITAPQPGDSDLLTPCEHCSYSYQLDDLRRLNRELQERVEELDAFAHTVAHDLKGSLGALRGFATILQEEFDTLSSAQREESLDHVVRSAYKLNNVVDELLLLVEIPKTDVVLEPIEMTDIVAAAQERLAPMIKTSGAEIILPTEWPLAEGHDSWVEEVWINYLSNAIKYGGRPPRVELGADVQSDGMVRFWVRDNGHGLTRTEQTRLFKPFTRLGTRRANGHGLGLSVVQHIVNKLGGQIGVESVPGEGSTFSFTLHGYQP